MSATPPFPTIQAAKAAGAIPGTPLLAPLAPAAGPIAAAPESLVVVTVKNFSATPTGKAVIGVLTAAAVAVGLALGSALISVWSAGKSIFDAGAIDWRTTERVCEVAGGIALVGGLMGLMKKRDNNPVN